MTTTTLESPTCSGLSPGATAEAPAEKPVVVTAPVHVPVELLDGGEVVILAIKPSPWFVLFDSLQWIVAGLVVVAGAGLADGRVAWVSYPTLIRGIVVLLACRLAFALLRWVSRFYLLTNRRVLKIHGVLRPRVLDLTLTDILNTRVTVAGHERLASLGTLRFACRHPVSGDSAWNHIARPDEVHAQVRRAIERAIDRQP